MKLTMNLWINFEKPHNSHNFIVYRNYNEGKEGKGKERGREGVRGKEKERRGL